MSIIKADNIDKIIKTLQKLGDIVVIAKGEIIYAFKKEWFPYLTKEQIIEDIKKSPKRYDYYKITTKIKEVKEVKSCESEIYECKKEKVLLEKIEMYDDLKEILGSLLHMFKLEEISRPTGLPHTKKQRLELITKTAEIYNKHFAC